MKTKLILIGMFMEIYSKASKLYHVFSSWMPVVLCVPLKSELNKISSQVLILQFCLILTHCQVTFFNSSKLELYILGHMTFNCTEYIVVYDPF